VAISHHVEDEPKFEPDRDGEPMPLAVLRKQDQSDVHSGFRDALDTLAGAGCQRGFSGRGQR
jgi:hypothetical protein